LGRVLRSQQRTLFIQLQFHARKLREACAKKKITRGGGGETRASRNLRYGADAQSFEIRQELLAGCSLGQASRLHLARVLQARLEQNHIVQIGVVDLPTAHRGHELGRYHDLPLDKQMYQR